LNGFHNDQSIDWSLVYHGLDESERYSRESGRISESVGH
jgi:hypothetical protein